MNYHQKSWLCSIILLLCLNVGVFGYVGYYSHPDIRGDMVLFNTQDNLWLVNADGGKAIRITASPVLRAIGKISPCGENIAYSGSVDGKVNIFVMPIKGGIPRKLTFHPANDHILGWSHDGRYVLFRSYRQSATYPDIYRISIDGGYPEHLNIGPASLISFAQDEDFIAFNIISNEFSTWKRYMGGTRMDIWAGRKSRMDFRKLTTFKGTDGFPMIYNERIYFISDRRGRMNIFSMDFEGEDLVQHTFYKDFDIHFPSLGDGRIVFQKGGDIYIYDIDKDISEMVEIEVPSENMSGVRRFVNAESWIGSYELSPDARTMLFEARGNLFLVPVKEGRTRTLVQDSSFRIKLPTFSHDGSKIAFFSDETGEEQLYYTDTSDNTERVAITTNLKGWHYAPEWSPDDSKIMFADEKMALYYYDIKAGRLHLIDRAEMSEIRDYSWSPDGKYIAYSKTESNTFSSIFIYDLGSKNIHRVTHSVTNDRNPQWDPDGEYLFFLSSRQFSPMLGDLDFQTIMTRMAKPYIVLLDKTVRNPLISLEPEEQEDDTRKGRGSEMAGKEKKVQVSIDFEGLKNRVFELPVPAGNYHGLNAVKDKIFFLSGTDYRMDADMDIFSYTETGYTLLSFDLKEREHKEFAKDVYSYHISHKKNMMAYRTGNRYRVVSIESPSFDMFGKMGNGGHGQGRQSNGFVDLSNINLIINPQQEWKQIFNEAVRLNRLLYWASNMAGIDWDSIASQYKALLSRISTRTELNHLIGELIGELSTGHTYIWGGDTGLRFDSISTGVLGADLEIDKGHYRISKILKGDVFYRRALSPLSKYPDIREGHYILRINGLPVNAETNIHKYLDNLGGREVLLGISKNTDPANIKEYKVTTLSNDFYLRYIDWVNSNREYVDRLTDGKVGYIHIPDMSALGMVEFNRQYYNQLDKDGLIIDVRFNGGGFVSQLIIERLRRELIFLDYHRYASRLSTYPYRVFRGHMVCLINESAGSDGDIFPEAFKKLGLGPLIGTTTWGGVIGIRMDKPFVDRGMMTIPEYVHYDPDHGWTIENIGVRPDIEVINFPQDLARGIDAQLDKGIEVLLGTIKENPIPDLEVRPYPDKSIDAWIKYWKEIGVDNP